MSHSEKRDREGMIHLEVSDVMGDRIPPWMTIFDDVLFGYTSMVDKISLQINEKVKI